MDSKTETVSDKTDNELIAEFHGWKKYKVGEKRTGQWHWTFQQWGKANFDSGSFQYHTSWDWIMPVWVKFRDLDFVEDSESDHKHMDWINSLQWYLFSSDEPKRFAERLAYAIKWYNSQSPNTIK